MPYHLQYLSFSLSSSCSTVISLVQKGRRGIRKRWLRSSCDIFSFLQVNGLHKPVSSYFLWSSVMSASLSNDASMETLNFSMQRGRLKIDMNLTITCGKLGVGKLGSGEEIV